MWSWFSKHAQAFAALFSALALIGLIYQVYATDQSQRAQSARDIYREFVALTINKPELATFQWNANLPEKDRVAYEAYVEYLLYTSEQVIAVDPEWREPMRVWLKYHMPFLCALERFDGYTPDLQNLIGEIKTAECNENLSSN
jgi:hypothetical protein